MEISKKSRKLGEVRLVNVADSHLSAHNPPSWKLNYWEQSEITLRQVMKYAIKNQADAVLWAGDIFHLKTPARNPLYFLSQVLCLMREIKEAGIENWGVAGNHDLKYGSLEGIKGQPVDILINSGTFHLLDSGDRVLDAGNFTVRVAGRSYDHGRAEGARDIKKNGSTYLVTLGHFWFGKASGEFFGEPLYGPDFLGQGESDVYVIGHHHDDQGITEQGGKKYVSVGAINRTGAHKNDLERRPAAADLTITEEGIKATILRPKTPPVDELFDLEKRQQVVKEQKEMEQFIETLQETKIVSLEPETVLEELNLSAEVKERVLVYLQEAEK